MMEKYELAVSIQSIRNEYLQVHHRDHIGIFAPADTNYSVLIRFKASEDRLSLERFSAWLLGNPPGGSLAVFPLTSALDVYGSVIGFVLESGCWKYGEWSAVRLCRG
eukprot:TRINITY_DN12472_c0_g1_i2.p1 TRINITY_DN12472_c0_g1~~TRINITY_DN12472_c0_g1_i2.p1  ORF type:complete len:107 (+),score=11.29 TRINITY_DN12472_c0_g1_i2:123-443(+)